MGVVKKIRSLRSRPCSINFEFLKQRCCLMPCYFMHRCYVRVCHCWCCNCVCMCSMRRKNFTERERSKIIALRYDCHFSQRHIARKLKCSQSSVNYVLNQHRHHIDSPQYYRSGRKKKLSSSQQNHLKNIIRDNNNLTAAEIQRHFFHHDNINVSLSTIQRYRRLFFHRAREILIPHLTQQHYLDRMDYCLTHINNNFHTVVFSDEKSFCLSHTSSTVWIEKDEPLPLRPISSTHTKVMVWGGIWYHGRTELGIIRGNIDHKKYMRILHKYLLPSMPSSNQFLFMHDNAPAHKPIAVEKMLHDFGVRLLDPYPAHSPDFNPIEHVWSWMTQNINKEHPTDRRSLIDAIQRS
jgi:transposase